MPVFPGCQRVGRLLVVLKPRIVTSAFEASGPNGFPFALPTDRLCLELGASIVPWQPTVEYDDGDRTRDLGCYACSTSELHHTQKNDLLCRDATFPLVQLWLMR